MSLLTYYDLVDLTSIGAIDPVPIENINGASIDVTLGPTIWREDHQPPANGRVVDLAAKQTPHMVAVDLAEAGGYVLKPGEFVLAQTAETFNLPDDIAAEFKLKSSGARSGLDNALATWCDPGWHGSVLTLELRNNLRNHWLKLTPGMKIGQMIFMRGAIVPDHASYRTRGQYNRDRQAQPSKGLR